jgi:hypothetical protein
MKYGIVDAYGTLNFIQRVSGSPITVMGISYLSANVNVDLAAGPAATNVGTAFNLNAGTGNTSGAGGNIYLTSGNGGATGTGGEFQALAGSGGATSGDGGPMLMSSGGAVSGTGGEATFAAGNGSAGGGDLILLSGNSSAGGAGDIFLRPGTGTPQGIIFIEPKSGGTAPELRFKENDASGTDYVGLKAPASVTTSYTVTMPAAQGATNTFLKHTGSGAYAWDTALGDTNVWTASNTYSQQIVANNGVQVAGADISLGSGVDIARSPVVARTKFLSVLDAKTFPRLNAATTGFFPDNKIFHSSTVPGTVKIDGTTARSGGGDYIWLALDNLPTRLQWDFELPAGAEITSCEAEVEWFDYSAALTVTTGANLVLRRVKEDVTPTTVATDVGSTVTPTPNPGFTNYSNTLTVTASGLDGIVEPDVYRYALVLNAGDAGVAATLPDDTDMDNLYLGYTSSISNAALISLIQAQVNFIVHSVKIVWNDANITNASQ